MPKNLKDKKELVEEKKDLLIKKQAAEVIENNEPELSVEEQISSAWAGIKVMQRKSIFYYIFINILSFALVALLIILNIFAIKWNPDSGIDKKLFVSIAILAGFVSALIAIRTLFGFKKIMNLAKEKIDSINEQYNRYKNKEGHYTVDNRDELIIKRVFDIKNRS